MKIAYFGTPIFSAILLEKLIRDKSLGIEIVLCVTQPDKPVGRKLVMTPSPVKVVAQKYKIPVFDSVIASANEKLKQIDLAIVYAYGFKQLIPLDLLKAPKMQLFINIHPSLLPLYRGSSPIAYPLLLGENKTGVTLFVLDEKMDHGPIIAQEEIEMRLTDLRSDMEKKLTDLGFEMVKKLLNSLTRHPSASLRVRSQVQNHLLATRAPYMNRDDGFVSFTTLQKALKNEPLTLPELPQIIQNYLTRHPRKGFVKQRSGLIIYNFWRGISPWPGLWTTIQPLRLDKVLDDRTEAVGLKRLKIINMEYVETCHGMSLHIKTVQLEGKKPVDFPTFQKAYQVFE